MDFCVDDDRFFAKVVMCPYQYQLMLRSQSCPRCLYAAALQTPEGWRQCLPTSLSSRPTSRHNSLLLCHECNCKNKWSKSTNISSQLTASLPWRSYQNEHWNSSINIMSHSLLLYHPTAPTSCHNAWLLCHHVPPMSCHTHYFYVTLYVCACECVCVHV